MDGSLARLSAQAQKNRLRKYLFWRPLFLESLALNKNDLGIFSTFHWPPLKSNISKFFAYFAVFPSANFSKYLLLDFRTGAQPLS